MQSKESWVELLKLAQFGHAPDPLASVEANLEEAASFHRHSLLPEGARVLDIGCGNGRQAIGLLDYKIQEYVGIEPIKPCVEFATAAFSGIPQCRFVWVDLQNDCYNPKGAVQPLEFAIPLPDGGFDTVITGSLFTHLGTAAICAHHVEEIHRVLKPGGRFFSSWFRNPPNACSESCDRTVPPESTIISILTRWFDIYHSDGGLAPDHNSQWCIYSKKDGRRVPASG